MVIEVNHIHPIRVVLADGQRWPREYLASLCNQAPDLELVALLDTGRDVVERIAALQPGVTVLDACLNHCDLAATIHQLAACASATRIVLLLPDAVHSLPHQRYIAGVTSTVLRSLSPETVLYVIRAAARGDGLVQREIAPYAAPPPLKLPGPPAEFPECLSQRERQVLCLLGQQRSNRAIGDTLSIAEETAKKHVQHILTKLHVHTRHDAARYAQLLPEHRSRA